MLTTTIPRLSVLMTNYNHGRYIAEALDAIINQSYKPFEVIVCDDGSTDNSVEIIQSFVDRYPFVRMIRNNINLGVVGSINKIITLASGDYLYWAAADDRILPDFFEKSMKLLSQYPQAGLCSALSLLINGVNNESKIVRTLLVSRSECFIPPERARLILQKIDSWIIGNTTLFRRKALLESGGFIPELHGYSDGFIEKVIAARYGACFIPKPLVAWRIANNNYSSLPARDPKIAKDIIDNYVNLMKSTYSDIFPKNYIEDERKRFICIFNASRLKFLEREKLYELKSTHKGGGLSLILSIQVVKIKMLLRFVITMLCLLIMLRPNFCRMLRIKTHNFFMKYNWLGRSRLRCILLSGV